MSPDLGTARQQATDSLNALARLGQSDAAQAILAEEAGRVSYDHIHQNADLSDEGKQKAVAARYVAQMNTVAKRLADAARVHGEQDRRDAANALGINGLSGDHASLSISRRDAADRVASVRDTTELQRMLTQATRNGDETLARAIADHAISTGDATTVNMFTADRPTQTAAVERLWGTAQRQQSTADLATHFHLASLRPTTLGRLTDYEIQTTAEQDINA